ncbi:hypothetical protein [Pseudomonas syringae]|uniref:hypothetical protein n=1 Tax=Pseudomonas syringae TaxID=317 RepID=UPI000F0048C4|nr:hypothetical protein [Pseudomonas syringae]
MKTVSRKSVEQKLSETLKTMDFAFSGGTAVYEIDEEFLGWIGFNIGNHPDFIRLNVSVGIHCIPVMEAFARGLGIKYRKGKSATYRENLSSITTGQHDYIVSNENNLTDEVDRLARVLVLDAKPFVERLANFQALENKVFPLIGQHGGNPELYALILLKSGKLTQFEEFAKNWLSECKGDQAHEWRKFISTVKSV